jgi:hypothetical protein
MNAQVCKMKLRQNFSQRTHPIHSIGPKSHVVGHFAPFHYSTKVGAKRAKLVTLMDKFAKQSCVGIFRNERTRSTPFDTKLMFWVVSHESRCKKGPNWCHLRTSSLNEVALEF